MIGCCNNAAWKYLSKAGVFSGPEFLARAAEALGGSQAKAPSTSTGSQIDTIFTNGTFLLAVPAVTGEKVTAVAVGGGKIVDVGDATRILAKKSSSTTVIDLGGATLSPGFIDSHAHVISAVPGIYSVDLRYTQCPTYDSVIAKITAEAGKAKDGDWVFFINFDPSLLGFTKGVGFPQLGFAQLDAISTKVNLFVENASGHIAYANSLAFATAGVTATTVAPPSSSYQVINGQLTGVMFEPPSFGPFMKHVPKAKVALGALPAMQAFLKSAQRQGITTLADPSVGVGGDVSVQLKLYNLLASNPERSVDLVGSIDLTDLYAPSGQPSPSKPKGLVAPSAPGGTGSYKNLTVPNLKIWADGSTQGYTGFLTQPYLTPVTPAGLGPVGQPDWAQANMDSLVGGAKADSWSVLIHANGDAALDLALQTLQNVYGAKSGFRNRIEHCTVTRPEQYTTMQTLGVTPSYLNNHVYIWGDTFYENILGPERANRLDAAADALGKGMPFSFHCDYATSLPEPLRYMQTAVTRQTSWGVCLAPIRPSPRSKRSRRLRSTRRSSSG